MAVYATVLYRHGSRIDRPGNLQQLMKTTSLTEQESAKLEGKINSLFEC